MKRYQALFFGLLMSVAGVIGSESVAQATPQCCCVYETYDLDADGNRSNWHRLFACDSGESPTCGVQEQTLSYVGYDESTGQEETFFRVVDVTARQCRK